MDRIQGRYKLIIISILVVFCLSLVTVFYGILHVNTVITHFFYIPIIMASLWWGRRGIAVAVFLALSLVAAHLLMARYYPTVDDYVRAFMFIVLSVVVALQSERISRTQERMRHFNLVVRSIRDINHLITKEKDLRKLIGGICEKLIKNRSYNYAWIALTDENSRMVWTAEAGLGESFRPVEEMLQKGTMPLCARRFDREPGVIKTGDPSVDCAGCPLSSLYAEQGKMTIGINPGGRIRGILSVSIPEDLIGDHDEQVLFEEIADDIEYALGGIELRDEHENTLEEFKESEERFRSIIENAPFGYYRVDTGGFFEYVNPEWERMLGISRDDIIGRHFGVVHPGEGRRQMENETGRVLRGETVRGEFGMVRKDGTMIYQTYYSQPLYHHGGIVGAEGFLNDITERKSAELALRRSRRMLSQIIEGSPIPAFVIDEEHRVTHWNRACEILTGFSSEEMVGTRRQWEPFYPEKFPTLADIIISDRLGQEGAGQFDGEFKESHVLEDARVAERFFPSLGKRGKWLSMTAAVLREAEGNITGAIETIQDVTERKKAEDEKIRAYTELEQIFNSTPVGMRVIDRNHVILHLNRRFMDMFDLDARHFARSGQADWDREILKADRVLMKRILSGKRYVEYEIRTVVNDEEAVFIVHASPYFSKEGNVIGMIENFTNITEMRNLQNGIMRIAEIERQRIGQDLHDGLGQNLTAVTFLIEALKEKTAERFKVGIPDIENIETMIRDAIVQTRSLSRMLSPVEMEKNGLRSALDEMAASTEKIFHVSCKVYQDGNFFVNDNQAATHLFYIAREAVTNSIKHGKAGSIHIHLVANSQMLRIVIQDDGVGAHEKKNTGLGLRIMRYRAGIIGADFHAGNREHGGFEVRVQMKP
ncbi:MAG: PAS domain S-box protein [Spirochaetes bacterium]|nr:PAS domain S-box protein [Spirochaetota bacterium]